MHDRTSNFEMVNKAIKEVDALIAMTKAMADQATLMRSDLALLLELRQRFVKLLGDLQ